MTQPDLFGIPATYTGRPGAHQKGGPSGGTDTWLTPPALLEALGAFDLDPCAVTEPRPWPTAHQHITAAEDGLRHTWAGRVWLNPPYSDARVWLSRLADHNHGTALLFARTDTVMFQRFVFGRAAGLLFLAGRVRFCRPDGKPAGQSGAPSVLVAYGKPDAAVLASVASELGSFIRTNP